MIEAPAIESVLPWVGVVAKEVPSLIEAQKYSTARIRKARTMLGQMRGALHPGMGSFALGSLGRLEASPQSDLDFALLFDSRGVSLEDATAHRQRCVEVLRHEFDVAEKTFAQPVDIRALVANVGGGQDSNLHLTYRSLLLTEGAWLHNQSTANRLKSTIFSIYARGVVSRGRFLNSLGNDLHRYYRTLCVDYRFKVEVQEKSWAIRILKLRHARKLWHLANIALQCWSVDAAGEGQPQAYPDAPSNDAQDAVIAQRIDWPPLLRVTMAMRHFGEAQACGHLFRCYERYLAAMSSEIVREELDQLPFRERFESDIYVALRQNADEFDKAAAAVVQALWTRCGDYLLRFCIL